MFDINCTVSTNTWREGCHFSTGGCPNSVPGRFRVLWCCWWAGQWHSSTSSFSFITARIWCSWCVQPFHLDTITHNSITNFHTDTFHNFLQQEDHLIYRQKDQHGRLVCQPDQQKDQHGRLVCQPDQQKHQHGRLVCQLDQQKDQHGHLVCQPDQQKDQHHHLECQLDHKGHLVCQPDHLQHSHQHHLVYLEDELVHQV